MEGQDKNLDESKTFYTEHQLQIARDFLGRQNRGETVDKSSMNRKVQQIFSLLEQYQQISWDELSEENSLNFVEKIVILLQQKGYGYFIESKLVEIMNASFGVEYIQERIQEDVDSIVFNIKSSFFEENYNFDSLGEQFFDDTCQKIIYEACFCMQDEAYYPQTFYIDRLIKYLEKHEFSRKEVIQFFETVKEKIFEYTNFLFVEEFKISQGKEFAKILEIQQLVRKNTNFLLDRVYDYFSLEKEKKTNTIQQEKEKNQELQELINQRINAVDNSAILMEVDTQWFITNFNDKLLYVTWFERDEILNHHTSIFGSGEHDSSFWQEMWEQISAWNVWQGIIINRNKQWERVYLKTTISPVFSQDGKIEKYVVIRFDVTQEQDLKNQLEYTLYYDELTNLPNYQQFKKNVEENDIKQAMVIKLNKFSRINSLYWYELGDKLIRNFATKLNNYLKNYGLNLYRTWEMEFWIIPDSDTETLDKNTIRKFFERTLETDVYVEELWTYVPVYVSCWMAKTNTPQDLYTKGMTALYESKKRWDIITYTPELEQEYIEKIKNNFEWIREVRIALEEDRIVPFFQWIVDNKTGQITKYESLVRITKDEKIFSPGAFLPYVEDTNLMRDITFRMIEKVIDKMKENNKEFSINLTWEDLKDIKTFYFIKKLLEENNISPPRLNIEVLEDVLSDENLLKEILSMYSEFGINVSIDDFGVGYSNISKFIIISPDYIKIDGSIVNWVSNDKEKQQILETIKYISQVKGVKTIAEFVETEEDQAFLQFLGIDYSQWFLFAKPTGDI